MGRSDVNADVLELPGGALALAVVPAEWNGTLVLYSQGPLAPPEIPLWDRTHPVVDAFVERGCAVTGWASTKFWHMEDAFRLQPEAAGAFAARHGTPDLTVGFGQSIGGLITAGLVQREPRLVDAALPVCGGLAGTVAGVDQMLDMAWVFKTLLADDQLQLADITDPGANIEHAVSHLHAAMESAKGRTRVSLLAAVTNIPGWDAADGEAAPDPEDQVQRQARWYREIVFMVVFGARAAIEQRAGGNGGSNIDVDYGDIVQRSPNFAVVDEMYGRAGQSIEDDLDQLAGTPRVAPRPEARAYLERMGMFDGSLEVPVLTLHTTGDGLCTPDNEQAYADVVRWAGNDRYLSQLFLQRDGHCTFTAAESVVALDLLLRAREAGGWDGITLEPEILNEDAARLDHRWHGGADAYGRVAAGSALASPRSSFCTYSPAVYPRAHDIRATLQR